MKKICSLFLSVLLCIAVLAGCKPEKNVEKPDVSAVTFENVVATYDGTKHSLTASGLPENVRAEYENNEQTDAGEYAAVAKLYFQNELLKTLNATLTVKKRAATVAIDDQISEVGETLPLTYTQTGVIEGDDLGVSLSVKTTSHGIKQIEGRYTNRNYDVTFTGGKYTVVGTLFDSSAVKTNEATFLPVWAPFVLSDKSSFSETVITSFSFSYGGLNGKSVTVRGLTLPLYVVPASTTNVSTVNRSDFTEANGKKILLDFTGKLENVAAGEWVTADDLRIEIGKEETLAFGDTDMIVLPQYTRGDSTYSFYSKIFSSGGQLHAQSLIFKIGGYSVAAPQESGTPEDDKKTYISFLGDSISTFNGYSNNTQYNATIGSNAIWFPNNNYTGANLKVDQTWWHRAFTELDYELCVNNSWSGSKVTDAQTYNVRAKNLHNKKNRRPDVVVVFMGVNDYAANVALGTYNGTTSAPATPIDFASAYGLTVSTIMHTYPDAEVYCCTFLPDRKRFSGNANGIGIAETAYNQTISTIAKNLGATVIDLYQGSGITPENIARYTVDRLHPNANGMNLIAGLVARSIRDARN